jgi:hypothetical protein
MLTTSTSPVADALPKLASARDLLRRHAIIAALLSGGLLLRAVAMLGYRPVIWFTGDSYFYLTYAQHLNPSPSKTLGYPFLLRFLEPAHSLMLVVALQHLMGLATALLIYLLLDRAGVRRWIAALATVPVLYDAYEIELEHMLMSEALFTFLLTAVVAMVLWRDGRRSIWVMAAAGLLLGWAILTRSAGVGAVPVVLACLALRRAGWRAIGAATATCALPLAGYALWFHSEHGTYALTSADGLYLWGRTSSFVDCAKLPASDRALCPPGEPGHRPAPGTIIWRNVPPRHMPGGPSSSSANTVLRTFSIDAIEAQPFGYVAAVGRSTARVFWPTRFHYPNRSTEQLYHFPARPHHFEPRGVMRVKPIAAAHSYDSANPSQVVDPWAKIMRGYQSFVFLPGPLLAVIFAIGAYGLFRRTGSYGRFRLTNHRTAALTAWGIAVITLMFPLATADFDYRYVLVVVPLACLAAAYAFAPERRTAPPEESSEAVPEG